MTHSIRLPVRLSGVLAAAFAVSLSTFALATVALAEDAPKLRDLCPDRPTKSSGPCTVDKGHWQVESDILNTQVMRTNGVTSQLTLITSPVIKYGVTDTSDIELGFTPYEVLHVTDHNTGVSGTLGGSGDLYARLKVEIVGGGGGNFTAALYPYVKAPTARTGLGDGAWEGGLITPLNWNLAGGWSMAVDPEADMVHNAAGSDYHVALQSPLTFSHPIATGVTGSVEVWALTDYDPSHTTHQYSADVAAAWQLNPNLQLDGGLNFGLNRATPGVQAYVGVSRRF